MTQHLIRIETVNLEYVLEDTDQLSVIRGGALMALDGARVRLAADQPEERGVPTVAAAPPSGFWSGLLTRIGLIKPSSEAPVDADATAKPRFAVESISSGASIGLYRLTLDSETAAQAAQTYREKVVSHLRKHYPQHTFVVDLEPIRQSDGEEGFHRAHQRLITANRVRQLRQPSFALPAMPEPGSMAEGPCAWDDLRPASVEVRTGRASKAEWVSASVASRYDYGRTGKTDFLRRESGIEDLDYAMDFEEIAGNFSQDRRLSNKLAVLYFDGNRFGQRQEECRTPGELKAFDCYMRKQRKKLLFTLLSDLHKDRLALVDPDAQAGSEKLRFELLLWGGDEILFVVPAWKGLDALHAFYKATSGWAWWPTKETQEQPLTHAGALIFCNYKTPIARMTDLAREVVERIKDHHGRKDNQFDYLILESVDFPAEPVERYWRKRYGERLGRQRRPLQPLPDARENLDRLIAIRDGGLLPHGKLHQGAHALVRAAGDAKTSQGALARLEEILAETAARPEAEEAVQKAAADLPEILEALFPDQEPAWRWLHLAELWDYLAPCPEGGVA